MAKKLRVAVIFGGRSGEHEVSLVSATSLLKTLSPKKYEVLQIGILKNGTWVSDGEKTLPALKSGKGKRLPRVQLTMNTERPGVIIGQRFFSLDVAFPILHGTYGEDGTIQGLFEMMGLAYVGCSVSSSAITMDKLLTKLVLQAHRLPQTPFLHYSAKEIKKDFTRVEKEVRRELGFPCFVKPSNMGSSVGISKVKKASALKRALLLAAEFDDSILVEQAVLAREIECAMLGNDEPKASVAGEIVPSREFYDFYAKYVDDNSGLFIPAKLSAKKMKEVQLLALKTYRVLQCTGMARVDFLMDRNTQKLFINEVNAIPGFTASISMFPKLWANSGIAYSELLDRLIALALSRHAQRNGLNRSFTSGSNWYYV